MRVYRVGLRLITAVTLPKHLVYHWTLYVPAIGHTGINDHVEVCHEEITSFNLESGSVWNFSEFFVRKSIERIWSYIFEASEITGILVDDGDWKPCQIVYKSKSSTACVSDGV
jgi:hypothetical protein